MLRAGGHGGKAGTWGQGKGKGKGEGKSRGCSGCLVAAATALYRGLELVTGNVRHFERVPGLRLKRALADARKGG